MIYYEMGYCEYYFVYKDFFYVYRSGVNLGFYEVIGDIIVFFVENLKYLKLVGLLYIVGNDIGE